MCFNFGIHSKEVRVNLFTISLSVAFASEIRETVLVKSATIFKLLSESLNFQMEYVLDLSLAKKVIGSLIASAVMSQ
jgi:hypothetical protein